MEWLEEWSQAQEDVGVRPRSLQISPLTSKSSCVAIRSVAPLARKLQLSLFLDSKQLPQQLATPRPHWGSMGGWLAWVALPRPIGASSQPWIISRRDQQATRARVQSGPGLQVLPADPEAGC